MEVGIYSHGFGQTTLGAVLDTIVAHGLYAIQFNLENAGLATMPDQIEPGQVARIRGELDARGVRAAALAGTYNMIDPDLARRKDGMRRLGVLAANAAGLGSHVISLCSGTRDPTSMWRRHPDNDTPEAWGDMIAAMAEAATIAEATGVILAVEPEVANVVDSAQKARRMLDEVRSPNLKICIDGANVFHLGELPRMREILDEAFQLLGDDIALAHAKDLDHDGAAGHLAAGTGLLDYDHYLGLLHHVGYDGAVVLHGLTEAQIDGCVAFLRTKIARIAG